MNIKDLPKKIVYQEFENLMNISFTNFHKIAIKNNYYSNSTFLDFFYEKIKYSNSSNAYFWKELILYSEIPVDELIKRFERFLKNTHVCNLIYLEKPVCYNIKVLERIEQYFDWFENYRN